MRGKEAVTGHGHTGVEDFYELRVTERYVCQAVTTGFVRWVIGQLAAFACPYPLQLCWSTIGECRTMIQ